MADGPDPQVAPHGEGPSGRPLPLSVRLLGAGVRGARSVGKAAGIDRAVEAAAEEAMVAAVESEAVERALVRVLQGPLVEEAARGALESDTVKQALVEALDSEMVDEVWRRLLASEEAQRLVERIAEAPELRAAISAQSVGFIEDVGHTIGDVTRRLDGVVERVVRRVLFRKRRTEPTERAGALTRGLAFGLDLLIVNLAFSGLAAIVALIGSFFSGNGNGVSGFALAVGSATWIALGALYFVVFWSLAGQTPGMRFFGVSWGWRDAAWRRAGRCGAWPASSSPRSPSALASSASSPTSAAAAGRTGLPVSTSSTRAARRRRRRGRLSPSRSRSRRSSPERRRPREPGAFGRSRFPDRRCAADPG
jgi:hypothetical protein